MSPRGQFDVLVAGGGMAGMVAAATAASEGASVAVAEKDDHLGGSAALSAGILWTAPDFETMRARVPQGDPDLGRALVDNFSAAVEFVRTTGTEVAPESHGHMGFGSGHQIDVIGLFDRLRARVEAAGGSVALQSAVVELLTDGGVVRGGVVRDAQGTTPVTASAVVLATGGFQGDRELLATFIGSGADEMLVRSNPGSVGDGFRMGRAVGAATSSGLSAFYGHLLPAPIVDFGERHYLPLTQYHSNRCLLVNWLGRRFMDESRGDEHAVQEVLRQPRQRAVLLADEQMRRTYVVQAPYPYGEVIDRFEESVRAGGRLAKAESIEDLVSAAADWGVPAANLRATLDRYERASKGEDVEVDAPLPDTPTPLREPPYYALEVQPAITFPHGGLRIDALARVLDRDGAPIAGLFAAGTDGGGVHNVGYAGGLATALVFGRLAGGSAIRSLEGSRPPAPPE